MTDKEKIKAEIERLLRVKEETSHLNQSDFNSGRWKGLMEVKSFIDSLPEEPASEDLEEEIKLIAGDYEQVEVAWNNDFDFIARHFANWQKEQMMKHAIVQTKFNLKATEEQQSFIESSFLEDTSIVQWEDDGIYLDDFISFDEMAKIVDYLRSNINK